MEACELPSQILLRHCAIYYCKIKLDSGLTLWQAGIRLHFLFSILVRATLLSYRLLYVHLHLWNLACNKRMLVSLMHLKQPAHSD